MPRPVSSSAIYLPGLDGLRAIAVVAVIVYHLDPTWLPGGLLGVGMFFTLSGYLITWILLKTWDRTGGLDLKTFWIRRARRLLPAVVLLLGVVVATTAAVDPASLAERARESLAALFYVANWTTIAADVSYFGRFAGPGPLDHLWSLAVEEQFYLLWPLLLLGLLKAFRGRVSRVAAATLGLAGLSFVLMTVLAQPGFDATRVYEGTDTRAGGLLIGAAVAMVWRPDRLTADIAPRARAILDGLGVAALAVIVALFVFTNPLGQMLYDGGLLLLSVATVLLVAVVVHPASRLAGLLGTAPMVWIGERSYGIYLWHLPVIVFTPMSLLADSPLLRAGLQVVASLALAALSWRLVEDPIRRQGLRVLVDRPVAVLPTWWRWPKAPVARRAVVLGVAATATLSTVALAGGTAQDAAAEAKLAAMLEAVPDEAEAAPTAAASGRTDPGLPLVGATPSPTATPAPDDDAPDVEAANDDADGDEADGGEGEAASASPAPAPAKDTPTTSCSAVVHVGDSTSLGLVDSDYLPDKGDRIPARFAEVGATDVVTQIDGAMSTVELYRGRPNATTRVGDLVAAGRTGCWVFAMGTNEAANQAVGGGVPFAERIDLLMDQVDGPVLWLTVRTTRSSGPYGDAEMQAFNDALARACDEYPNMRVYDWRSEVRDDWFISDGIHFTSEGYRERARRIAWALATAFPADGEPVSDCFVGSGRD